MMCDALNYYSCLFPLYMHFIESSKMILFHIYSEIICFLKKYASWKKYSYINYSKSRLNKFFTANDIIVKPSQEGKLYLFCPMLKCLGL